LREFKLHEAELLFVTQKIAEDDDDLAFVILWINEFMRQGVGVQVICLEKGITDVDFPVYSLGKEQGKSKLVQLLNFLKFIFTLRYNRVFIHMNPIYVSLGGWYWLLRRTPIYLWYTHYSYNVHVRMAGWLCRRMFAATNQSLPQYNGSNKKVVVGHGIDLPYWLSGDEFEKETRLPEHNLLAVHRLCRSKRLELAVLALKYLPEEYTLTVYGPNIEKDYVCEIEELICRENLGDRVFFKGSVAMSSLRKIYPRFWQMINMAPETIDKTLLEGMIFGVYPVTTKNNAQAIGLPHSPAGDSPEEIARFIMDGSWKDSDTLSLRRIVDHRHNLASLVRKMVENIVPGS